MQLTEYNYNLPPSQPHNWFNKSPRTMEITKFVVEGRDEAKLYGDSSAYRGRLSNRIHNLRKKLGIATKPRAKYSNRPVTAEDIGHNHEYINALSIMNQELY